MDKNEPTGWVGWVFFASVMMLIAGGLQSIAGLTAIFKDDFYVATQQGVIAFSYTTWGWIHLALGILVFAAGIGVLSGSAWARVVGVFLAVLGMLAQLSFLSAYPIWSIISTIIYGLVIYALTMHGAELKD